MATVVTMATVHVCLCGNPDHGNHDDPVQLCTSRIWSWKSLKPILATDGNGPDRIRFHYAVVRPTAEVLVWACRVHSATWWWLTF